MSAHAADGRREALRNRLKRVALDAGSLAGGRTYRRFVIVGVARTGSTVLISLLNAHSQAICFGEIFRQHDAIGWDVRPWADVRSQRLLALYQRDPVRFVETVVWRRWPAGRRAVGFKLFYYHARQAPFSEVWAHLAGRTDVAVIHIKRRNILAQYLSLQLAHRTDVWSTTQAPAGPTEPIRLGVDDCARHFAEVRAMEEEAERFFAGHPMLQVAYEDVEADKFAQMARIEDFLGLRREAVDTPLRRQRTAPLSAAIANYAELEAAFAGNEWGAFFPQTAG